VFIVTGCQKVFHGNFCVCVNYVKYILSYCSCSCPLSSLCSIFSVAKGEEAGVREKGWSLVDYWYPNNWQLFASVFFSFSLCPSPSLLPSFCSLSETSGGCGIPCLVAFQKKKKKHEIICRVHCFFFFCNFLYVFVKPLHYFLISLFHSPLLLLAVV